jgi:hypothetical protein
MFEKLAVKVLAMDKFLPLVPLAFSNCHSAVAPCQPVAAPLFVEYP